MTVEVVWVRVPFRAQRLPHTGGLIYLLWEIYFRGRSFEAKFFLLMRIFLFLLTLLCCAPALSGQKKQAPSSTFDLKDALQQKLVSITVAGTGGHMGSCLTLTCKNLRGKFLRLRIPQGQFMEPSDSTFQTLVVAEEQTVALGTKTPAQISLSTFCAQAGDRSPASGAAFIVGAMAPEQLCKLLKFIAEKGKAGSSAAQTAVWCFTNGESLGSIDDPELTKFAAELLGKNVPGYKIKRQTVEIIPGEHARLGKALVVEANYQYTLEKDEKLLINLLQADGKLVKLISKEETLKAGEHRSGIHLEVWNLPPGKYIVRIQTKDGRVIKDLDVEF